MRIALALLIAAGLAGCASPEATRRRGGGAGGDMGNRPARVKMHEGSNQYYKTPIRIPVAHGPLDPAQDARRKDMQ